MEENIRSKLISNISCNIYIEHQQTFPRAFTFQHIDIHIHIHTYMYIYTSNPLYIFHFFFFFCFSPTIARLSLLYFFFLYSTFFTLADFIRQSIPLDVNFDHQQRYNTKDIKTISYFLCAYTYICFTDGKKKNVIKIRPKLFLPMVYN